MTRHYNRSTEDPCRRVATPMVSAIHGDYQPIFGTALQEGANKPWFVVCIYICTVSCTRLLHGGTKEVPPLHVWYLPAEQKFRKKLVRGGWGRPGRLTLVVCTHAPFRLHQLLSRDIMSQWTNVTLFAKSGRYKCQDHLAKSIDLNVTVLAFQTF